MTMDIPLNAEVHCADGVCGRSTYVIVNPVNERVTHVVVREEWFPHAEHLVPLDLVIESTPDTIRLRCTKDDLVMQEPFTEVEYIEGDLPGFSYERGDFMLWPYTVPEEEEVIPVEIKRVPPGELAVRRGTHVKAADGRVGQVDEFLVDPVSEHITHLILREGHLWGQKDVTIPVSEIARIEEDTVHLKLTKEQVEALPTIPVRRRYNYLKG
jgi:sporulation protein YlmC with PRC-barrel domain